jgi:ABC-type lipoprotein export system ATPase subunit
MNRGVVEVRDLFRIYSTDEGDAAALQGLSLTVADGELVVVLGPSGSGKTTLLRILAGLERPSAGVARVFGLDVGRLRGRKLAAYRSRVLGYADQHYTRALAPELQAWELVSVGLGLRGATVDERRARAAELLERVGLADRSSARPGELSGGEQQRIALCAAVAGRPKLLLVDEPTGELDSATAQGVYDLLRDLSHEVGCTTLVVSHDPESTRIADRVVHVRDGRVSAEEGSGGGAESIVVAKGGWVHLGEDLLRRAGIGGRARAELDQGRLVVRTVGPEPSDTVLQGQEAPETAAAGIEAWNGGPAAELRAVAKRFGSGGGRLVFHDLNGSFDRGRVVAVTGPSGSGKTTLLRLLAGLERPNAGEVLVLGTAMAGLDRTALARFRRGHVGFVAQDPELVPFLGARENLELALELRGVDGDRTDRAQEALEAVGVGDLAGQRVSRLSSGERQRVAVARALAARPALLLADEPTARLDGANALGLAALLGELARDWGTAVVCATHDPYVIDHADDALSLA